MENTKNAEYWIISDKLGYGTYTNDRAKAFQIRDRLIADGATDARIECEVEIDGRNIWYIVN